MSEVEEPKTGAETEGQEAPRRRRRRSILPPAPPAMREAKPLTPRQRIVLCVIAPVAIVLAWRTFTLGMSDLWGDSNPDRALYWRSAQPDALVDAANDAFLQLRTKDADALAAQAIAAYPLDGRGYRVIAGSKDLFGDKAAEQRLLNIAIRRSPRDLAARSRLLEFATREGDVDQALHQIDIELRIAPDVAPDLLKRLVAASDNPVVAKRLDRMLVGRPPWRQAYLNLLARAGDKPEVIEQIFAGKGGDDPLPPPATGTEADFLLQRQITDGRWGNAYYTWASRLSEVQRTGLGNIYDGDFTFAPANTGFDWRIPGQGMGVDVFVSPKNDDTIDKALQLHFDGLPLDFQPVQQLLVLAPGHYRLTGMGQTDGMTAEDGGLQWTVGCAEGKRQNLVGTAHFDGDMPWAPFQVEFDVPQTGCSAQWLQLVFSGGVFTGQPLVGDAAFDNLNIQRLAAPPVVPRTAADIAVEVAAAKVAQDLAKGVKNAKNPIEPANLLNAKRTPAANSPKHK